MNQTKKRHREDHKSALRRSLAAPREPIEKRPKTKKLGAAAL
jgi:hypothetical protein